MVKEIYTDVQDVEFDYLSVYQEGEFSETGEDLEVLEKYFEEFEVKTTDREVQNKGNHYNKFIVIIVSYLIS